MSILDRTIFGYPALAWAWYNWAVFLGLALAFIAVFWVFYDSQRNAKESTLWKVLVVIGLILVIPALLLRVSPDLAITWSLFDGAKALDGVRLLAYIGLGGAAICLVSLLLFVLGVAVKEPPEFVPQPPSGGPTEFASPIIAVPAPPLPPPPANYIPTALPQGGQPLSEPGRGAGAMPAPDKTIQMRREPPQMAWLVQVSGTRIGTNFRLGEVTNIGRDAASNDIVVDDSFVSRQHARIKLEDGKFVLYDLASENHTYVNGEEIVKHTLSDGDKVRFAGVDFQFMEIQQQKA